MCYVLQGKNAPNKTSLKKQSEFQKQPEMKSEHSKNWKEAYPFFELRRLVWAGNTFFQTVPHN